MRISDWSSDVCSSDLQVDFIGFSRGRRVKRKAVGGAGTGLTGAAGSAYSLGQAGRGEGGGQKLPGARSPEQDRDDRKSAVSGKGVSVRVDLGGCSILDKKNFIILLQHIMV